MDTIYAVSSGRLPSGVAVVRISGPQCRFVTETMCGTLPPARVAHLIPIRDRNETVIDRGLVLWFPGPASFTGEDVAEFHLHGSRAVVAALGRALATFVGVREAEAGEFTRRAFINGKMDLTEVEGLADLLVAETEAQRQQALAQTAGSLRNLYDGWRTRLIRARALLEADLDFADEEDVPGSAVEDAFGEVGRLTTEIRRHLDDGHRGERLRDGFQVVLLGAPNAGKSSLLNALARRDVAIVADEAGTTRDIIELHLDIAGLPVTLVDTAGLREGGGRVEREGMRRALDRSARADLILWLVAPDIGDDRFVPSLENNSAVWRIDTKCDLYETRDAAREVLRAPETESFSKRFCVSATTGAGLDILEGALAGAFRGEVREMAARTGDGCLGPTRDRHRAGLSETLRHLDRAMAIREIGLELAAESLRSAADSLGRITGRIDVEDLLDVIFRDFCIGK